MTQTNASADTDLKARHRTMWASGNYPDMVETFLLPLGPRLVDAAGVGAGRRVLDVAAGTGNAAIPAAQRGADVVASDLTPELLEAGEARARQAGVDLQWTTADAENLSFDDASFDIVISAIGAMFAPHHDRTAAELARVCRPGGTVGLLSWTPGGTIGSLFRAIGPFNPPPPAGVQPPPLWGSEDHVRGLFGTDVTWTSMTRATLEVTAFPERDAFATHFSERYGPTIAARKNAVANGREAEFDAALKGVFHAADVGGGDGRPARYELEYLLSVGTRA
jgi:SAM-dependent methyltransferase